jgi:hypothetical protein
MITNDIGILVKKIVVSIIVFITPLLILGGGVWLIKQIL